MRRTILAAAAILMIAGQALYAAPKKLTIFHTNDMHSHLLGFSPMIDYVPGRTGADKTLGGWARIATLIQSTKKEKANPVLVLDAGDFLMGTLFHSLSREYAYELRLMKKMGYEAVGLGNHEFDLTPDGLAQILVSGRKHGMPNVICSNLTFSKERGDDSLEDLYNRGYIEPYKIIVKDGMRVGIFGLIGKNAAEVSPFASPVAFGDTIATARRMVAVLRDKEKADIVICLSHSGLSEAKTKSEDEILAREVKGIDVIISGHTHTRLDRAITVNGTIIVSAWVYGMQAGILDLTLDNGRVGLASYKTVLVNSSIKGDDRITADIAGIEAGINTHILKNYNTTFNSVIAHTKFDLMMGDAETNLGNLITDSIIWAVNKYDSDPKDPMSRVAVGINSGGMIRENILAGNTGDIAMCDLFSAVPLGIGFEEGKRSIGYPLVSFYLYASELKKGLEILTSVYPMKGSDYFLQISGLRFKYNPNRMLFDRVTGIWIGSEEEGFVPLDYSSSNKKLYRVAANMFNATFIKVVGKFTYNILDIKPKDRSGSPIEKLADHRVDMDRTSPGIQELKEWAGLLEYMRSFPDANGSGVPEVPDKYRGALGRINPAASWNPVSLLEGGNYLTWAGFSVLLLAATGSFFLIRRGIKKGRIIK